MICLWMTWVSVYILCCLPWDDGFVGLLSSLILAGASCSSNKCMRGVEAELINQLKGKHKQQPSSLLHLLIKPKQVAEKIHLVQDDIPQGHPAWTVCHVKKKASVWWMSLLQPSGWVGLACSYRWASAWHFCLTLLQNASQRRRARPLPNRHSGLQRSKEQDTHQQPQSPRLELRSPRALPTPWVLDKKPG